MRIDPPTVPTDGVAAGRTLCTTGRRRVLSTVAFLAAVSIAPAAWGQGVKRLPRVAYVYLFPIGPSAPYVDAFLEGMGTLGWVDGKTMRFEVRYAQSNPEKLAAIMRDLVESKVDVIVAVCTPEAMAAKKATSTIPVVVTSTGDPVRSGLITSLARPGGNITGVTSSVLSLSAKRVEVLRELSPRVRKASVLWNPIRSDNAMEYEVMRQAGDHLGVQVLSQQVRDGDELDVALDAINKDGTEAVLEAGDGFLEGRLGQVLEFVAQRRLPGVYDNRTWTDAGGLMSYGPNLPQLNRRAAGFVDRILRGAKPADLPFEQPDRFELVINLKTAKALGISIPQSLRVRADEVLPE